MNEEEKTTDNGQPTTDGAQQDKEKLVNNEYTDDNISPEQPVLETEQPSTQNKKQPANNENKAVNPSSVNPVAETEQTSCITDHTSNIQDMEVHKHPHHITHKKKLGEYMLEFFMLFLAVFLGFLAENFREHQVERQKGREYIESFYEDLKIDTARLNHLIDIETKKIAALSQIRGCYDSISKNLPTASFIDIIKNSQSNNPFQMDGRTMQQLTNAGGFRLLPKVDSDSIIAYEKQGNTVLEYQHSLYQQTQDNLRNTFNEVISFVPYSKLYSDVANNPVPDATGSSESLFFTTDKVLLNKYFNQLFQYWRVISQHQKGLRRLNGRAIQQLEYFKNKYQLE